jgi:hypothetical protein
MLQQRQGEKSIMAVCRLPFAVCRLPQHFETREGNAFLE